MAGPGPYDDDNPVARVLGPVVALFQIACGWALLAICVATLYDIVARRLFGHSVQGVNEIGAYLLAIVSAFGFASARLLRDEPRFTALWRTASLFGAPRGRGDGWSYPAAGALGNALLLAMMTAEARP